MGDLQQCIEEDNTSILGNGNYQGARSFHSSATVGKRIYIFGGYKGGSLANDVQIFETSTGKCNTPL
ncbi:hypothetical protein E8P77_35375, partial [Soehngenia saccharolytica]